MTAIVYRALRIAWSVRQWMVRRMTPAGLLALGVVVIAAAAGIDTQTTLAYRVFCFALALLLAARRRGSSLVI